MKSIKPTLISLLIFTFFISGCSVSREIESNNLANITRAEIIAATFRHTYNQHLQIKKPIKVKLWNKAQYSDYNEAQNVLYIAPYESIKEDKRSFLESNYTIGAYYPSAKSFYDDLIFHFQISHELNHTLIKKLEASNKGNWDLELKVNVLTLIFLEKEKQLFPDFEKLMKFLKSLNEQLAGPLKNKGITHENIPLEFGFDPKNEEEFWFFITSNILEANALIEKSNWSDIYEFITE